MLRQRKVYRDWSGGHWGSLGPFKCDDNQYRAINLQVYANGTLGPRPGWKELTLSGTGPNISAGAGQEFYGIVWIPGLTDGGKMLFVSQSHASSTKRLDIDTLTWETSTLGTPGGTIVADPNCHSFAYENPQQVVVGATKIYNPATDTTTTITYPDSFVPTRAAFYGARLYAWGDTTYPNRVYYSSADAFSTFVSGQYFNIGPGGSSATTRGTVMDAWPLKDRLLFYVVPASKTGKQLYGEWWTLTGPNVINGELRRIGRDLWPAVPNIAALYRDAVLFQDQLYEMGGICVHDGSALNTSGLRHLGPRAGYDNAAATAGLGAAVAYGRPAVILPYRVGGTNVDISGTETGENFDNGLQAWELVNNTWTKASYWHGAVAEVVTNDRRFLWGICTLDGDKLLAVTNTTSGGTDTYRVFVRDICRNRPSRPTDTFGDPDEEHADIAAATDLSGQLWLSAITADEGESVRASSVTLELDYWKGGTYDFADPELEVQVATHRIERGDFQVSETLTAELSALEETTAGNAGRARIVVPLPNMPWGSAIQIRFVTVKNVAFDVVAVDYEVRR
jgi:hypothetical protein